MATELVKMALKQIAKLYQARPRSVLELYEMVRDEVVLRPQFQYVLWWLGCMFVFVKYALAFFTEYCIMCMMCYIVFTIPLLRWCSVWTKLYQDSRNQKEAEEEEATEKPVKQKKKKAMTEDEMLEATRKKQKNRKDGRRM